MPEREGLQGKQKPKLTDEVYSSGLVSSREREVAPPESLVRQYRYILARNQEYNNKLRPEIQRPASNYEFLDHFFHDFFTDRISRAKEVKSDRYKNVVEKVKNKILRGRPMFKVKCVDGRDLAVHEGFTADTVETYRVAGGDPAGFEWNENGEMVLDPASDFALEVKDSLLKSESGIIAEVWGGTHIECAAGDEKQSKRGDANDGGLLQAMVDRVMMVEATQKMIAYDPDLKGRTAIFIPNIFNVKNGHTYWGAERPSALSEGKQKGGYTLDALDEMSQEDTTASGKRQLLSTKEIIESNDDVLDTFMKHMTTQSDAGEEVLFRPDWENKYVETSEAFYDNVIDMQETLLPIMGSYVRELYPPPTYPADIDITTSDGEAAVKDYHDAATLYKEEYFMRSISLLLSAYTGFLNNLPPVEAQVPIDEQSLRDMQDGRYYKHKDHIEKGVKASVGTHPPYRNQMFAVFVKDHGLPDHAEIAHKITRRNRKNGKVIDESGTITNRSEWVNASVPFTIKEVVKKERPLTDREWRFYQELDFSDLPDQEWDEWTSAEHVSYLRDKGVPVPNEIMALIELKNAWVAGDFENAEERQINFIIQLNKMGVQPTPGMLKKIRLGTAWEDDEFFGIIKDFGFVLPPMVKGMDNLRSYMKRLYGHQEMSGHLIGNQLVAMPVISDGEREPRMIMPYIKLGKKLKKTI